MKNNLLIIKKELRKKQLVIRKELYSNNHISFNNELFEKLFKKINFQSINIVSSFMSINTEISTKELNNLILKKNKKLCLPIVFKENSHLEFREFSNYQNLNKGFMNIKEPPATNQILIPELLFVPCLAFDKFGFRLGYGGGYYDRTFNFFKNKKRKFLSVGYAFDDQKVSRVPKDDFDIKLDNFITEKKKYSYK